MGNTVSESLEPFDIADARNLLAMYRLTTPVHDIGDTIWMTFTEDGDNDIPSSTTHQVATPNIETTAECTKRTVIFSRI